MFKCLTCTPYRQFSTQKSNDYYQTLGIKRTAKRSDIKKAYFKLAKKYHPDVNSSVIAKEKFAQILKAYETLSDSKQRDLYDLENDYSSQGQWKGFHTEDYSQYQGSKFGRKRSKGGFRNKKSQGFWDFQGHEEPIHKRDDKDPFDEFFFTGNEGATPKENDMTRGKDIEMNLEVEFMDALNG